MAARKRAPRSRKAGSSSEQSIPEMAPPQDGVTAPPYGYVAQLVRERERQIGAAATSAVAQARRAGQSEATRMTADGTRSLTDIVREVRNRRKLLVTPPIPRAYRKTAQIIRAGQAIFADIALRLPAVLAAKPMMVEADPLDDEDDSQQIATKKEEWTTAVLLGQEGRRAVLDQGKTSVWRDLMDNLVNAGRGTFTLQARLDRWGADRPGYPRLDLYENDGEDVPASRRRSADQKYRTAQERFKRTTFPFVLEHIDPLSVHIAEDDEGTEDEAVVVVNRPRRETLRDYSLMASGDDEGPGVVKGNEGRSYKRVVEDLLEGDKQAAAYGRAFPLNLEGDYGIQYQPEHVETVTWFCSAKRAWFLGLVDEQTAVEHPDLGVWAHYVDGVYVDGGPLHGPREHPLPVFRCFGLSTAMGDPTYHGVTPMMHLIELIDLLDQIITMELHISFWSAFPPLLEEDKSAGGPGATGLPGDVVNDPEEIQRPKRDGSKEGKVIEPGKFYSVPPGRQWRYLVMPPDATAHLERLYTKATALIDLIGIPSVFRGTGNGGQAGYAIAQLMIAAKSLYDPVVENMTATVGQAIMYLWWQVWRRFPEGVPVYFGGDSIQGKKKGWRTLTPGDLAPDARKEGEGTPFLACSVQADPLLPTDEAQLEQRGIAAQAAGAVDMLTMRERYFHDPAPERTEARVLADRINTHPLVMEVMALRGAVRQGVLLPEMAMQQLQNQFKIDPRTAFDQLRQVGAMSPEDEMRIGMQMAQAEQAGGQAPIGGVPGPPQLPPGAPPIPVPPQAPPIQGPGAGGPAPGAGLNPTQRAGTAPPMPTTNERMVQAMTR